MNNEPMYYISYKLTDYQTMYLWDFISVGNSHWYPHAEEQINGKVQTAQKVKKDKADLLLRAFKKGKSKDECARYRKVRVNDRQSK